MDKPDKITFVVYLDEALMLNFISECAQARTEDATLRNELDRSAVYERYEMYEFGAGRCGRDRSLCKDLMHQMERKEVGICDLLLLSMY